ncbi:hypothetical protein [Neisseria sp. Ec49-e6-T10]|uniref:hypothetical protein n=1 Tax=Neisseria sp. Ec49-e6-T10 TaxID=3140744 RepID=UPI003EB82CE6
MQKYIIALSVICSISIVACSNKTDANEQNFTTAMNQYFDKKGDLCLNIKKWPVDVSEGSLGMQNNTPSSEVNRMVALEAVGLVRGEDAEVQGTNFSGEPNGVIRKVKRYMLTDAAKNFIQEKDVDSIGMNGKNTVRQTKLCWGKQNIDKIVKWEGPIKLGDYQEVGITYTYKINNIADWAKKPEIQAAFPEVKNIIDNESSREIKHGIKLTSQGWEAKGLIWE